MYSNTVMKISGQSWKLYVATVLIWVGIALSIFGALGNLFYLFIGLPIGLFGIAFCCLAIRCPACGQRWYWQSIKELKFGWVKKLISQSECKSCGYTGANAA
jgi:hypothetical protein